MATLGRESGALRNNIFYKKGGGGTEKLPALKVTRQSPRFFLLKVS
jgi:hypothetical protein